MQQDTITGKFVRPANGIGRPALDSVTPQQGAMIPPHAGGIFGLSGRDIYACGNYTNPCGFPGWGGAYRGTYATYDFMLEHPIIAHARSIVFDACRTATWTVGYDKTDPPPQAWIDLATKMFVPRRQQFYADLLRGLDYGWAPFEKVWQIRDGRFWLRELKPLLHHWTWIVTERNGDYAGLSQGAWAADVATLGKDADKGEPVKGLPPNKSFVYSHDQYAGYRYGRSRLENLRSTAWRDWLDTAQQLHRLGNRLVGIYLIGYAPHGETQDPATGQKINLQQSLTQGIQGMVLRGDPALIVTNLSLEVDDPDLKAKLAGSSLVKVDKLDFGNLSPAVDGLLRRQVHNEESFYKGYLRSPRVGSESQHGSRADSERHTQTGDRDAQLICGEIDAQFSIGMLDDAMVYNVGERARGRLWLTTADLDDNTPQMSLNFLGVAVQADKTVAERAMEIVNVKQVLTNAGLPTTDKTWEDTQADVAPPAPPVVPLSNNQVPINQQQ